MSEYSVFIKTQIIFDYFCEFLRKVSIIWWNYMRFRYNLIRLPQCAYYSCIFLKILEVNVILTNRSVIHPVLQRIFFIFFKKMTSFKKNKNKKMQWLTAAITGQSKTSFIVSSSRVKYGFLKLNLNCLCWKIMILFIKTLLVVLCKGILW